MLYLDEPQPAAHAFKTPKITAALSIDAELMVYHCCFEARCLFEPMPLVPRRSFSATRPPLPRDAPARVVSATFRHACTTLA